MTDPHEIHVLLEQAEQRGNELAHAEHEAELAHVAQDHWWYAYLSAKKKVTEATGHRAWKREVAIAEAENVTRAFCRSFIAYEQARDVVKRLRHAYEELQAQVSTGCREWIDLVKEEPDQ